MACTERVEESKWTPLHVWHKVKRSILMCYTHDAALHFKRRMHVQRRDATQRNSTQLAMYLLAYNAIRFTLMWWVQRKSAKCRSRDGQNYVARPMYTSSGGCNCHSVTALSDNASGHTDAIHWACMGWLERNRLEWRNTNQDVIGCTTLLYAAALLRLASISKASLQLWTASVPIELKDIRMVYINGTLHAT
jgi:hypothetical protein